jgi:uncharacterized membrane protein YozB (DUF420 family)
MSVLAFLAVATLLVLWVYFRAYLPSVARFTMTQHFWFYPVVMVHMVTSSIALGASVFAIWPRLRRTRPHIHRRIGRIYVLAGIFPACITAAILETFWPEPVINEFSDVFTTILWAASTAIAFRFAIQRRIEEHRRWMLRSFALTMSFTVSMIILLPISEIVEPMLHTWQFTGNRAEMTQAAAGIQVWLSWVLPLIAIEWWMDYERIRRRKRLSSRRPGETQAGNAASLAGVPAVGDAEAQPAT